MGDKRIDIVGIMDKLPHRYPFLLVDRILDYEEGKRIKGIKNLTINEHFFQGHFPGHPIMPGVLIIEAMAQACGVLAMLEEGSKGKIGYFMKINSAKFRRPVIPGDQLVIEIEIVKIKGPIVQAHGTAYVESKKVAEADLMFSFQKRT